MDKKAEKLERPASLGAFGASLRRRRESLGLTLDVLMDKTGISKPYLSNIETARAPGPPSEEKLRKLARALAMPAGELLAAADWLRTPLSVRKLVNRATTPRRADGTIDLDEVVNGQKSVFRRRDDVTSSDHWPLTTDHFTLTPVPLINRVAAGKATEYTDLDYPAGVADQYVPAPDLPDTPLSAAFALKITGDSMAPDYTEGEIIVLGPPVDIHGRGTVADGDDCVVRLADHANFATTFKRIFFVVDAADAVTALRLAPINPAYPERIVPLDQITGVYPLLYRLVPPRRRD